MNTSTEFASPSRHENFLPILERATQEVFEIMLGCQIKSAESSGTRSKAVLPPSSGWLGHYAES
jgi:hypothetical protein